MKPVAEQIQHLAIIMDGNGRWAEQRGLKRQDGHRKGVETLRDIVQAVRDKAIPVLTLYAFSSENQNRPPHEVKFLMHLAQHYIESHLAELHEHDIRIRVIGDKGAGDERLRDLLTHSEQITAHNKAMLLQIAFGYGAREEITQAVQGLVAEAKQGKLTPDEVSFERIRTRLYTHEVADPDLLIRTGGEQRLSNFLLLQSAYSELLFQPILWPDYTVQDLEEALADYHSRERRFGNVLMVREGQ